MSKSSTRRPFCTCPACDSTTTPDGIFYCCADREWAAYSKGQFIYASKASSLVAEALAVYRIDQAAAEADMAHDVQLAATDSDVVAALAPRCSSCGDVAENTIDCGGGQFYHECEQCQTCRIDSLPYRGSRGHVATLDAAARAANAALPEYPPFLYYDRHQGGVVYAGSDTAYPSYIEAALVRDGK